MNDSPCPFLLFLFNFHIYIYIYIIGLKGPVCHSLPNTTDVLRKKYFFSSSVPSAWKKHWGLQNNNIISHLSRSLACSWHNEDSYNLEKCVISVINFHLCKRPIGNISKHRVGTVPLLTAMLTSARVALSRGRKQPFEQKELVSPACIARVARPACKPAGRGSGLGHSRPPDPLHLGWIRAKSGAQKTGFRENGGNETCA